MNFKAVVGPAITVATIAGRLLGELVGPSGCAACDARVPSTVLFCATCAASVLRATSVDGVHHAAFEYGGAIATAIARLKYQERPDLGARLGGMMATTAERLRGCVDIVVPVPLHPKRLAERGYNQAALLSRPIARALDVAWAPRALQRRLETPRQTASDRESRLLNVRDAFVPRPRDRPTIAGSRALLIDDVRTTGATLDACATALRAAGARRVFALVLARRI